MCVRIHVMKISVRVHYGKCFVHKIIAYLSAGSYNYIDPNNVMLLQSPCNLFLFTRVSRRFVSIFTGVVSGKVERYFSPSITRESQQNSDGPNRCDENSDSNSPGTYDV